MARRIGKSVAAAPELGIDIVEIGRIRTLLRANPKFLTRVFSAEEAAYCRRQKKSWQHFAVRFAAKEAVWKALDSDRVRLKDISVGKNPSGKPVVLLKGKPAKNLKLSLSHGRDYAIAVAMMWS